MKILSWNVNGLRAALKKGFADWFSAEKPGILCLQETKALPEQVEDEDFPPEGYGAFWNNPAKKGYAGVAVLSSERPLEVDLGMGSGPFETEGRVITAHYRDLVLVNCYFPNGGMGPERLAYKLEFYDRFLGYVDGIKNRDIVICGDFNTAHREIDLARPKQNEMNTGFLPEERAWLDKFISHGYVDVFRRFDGRPGRYTWWDYKTRSRERNVGWRIDYFFVTEKFLPGVKNAFIMSDVKGSDHCPLGIEI
ncbi:MAG: exodeoxyribonuclease III [Candidatus Omnitrophica bacterium]|nr:exodeoxyribonuclease III [Candidatus Omnitrophota bacterium]